MKFGIKIYTIDGEELNFEFDKKGENNGVTVHNIETEIKNLPMSGFVCLPGGLRLSRHAILSYYTWSEDDS